MNDNSGKIIPNTSQSSGSPNVMTIMDGGGQISKPKSPINDKYDIFGNK